MQDAVPWRASRRANQYATGDDRFTFPPVPGYTGYVPRSREHFGKSYSSVTKDALSDFNSLCVHKAEVSQKLSLLGPNLPVPFVPKSSKGILHEGPKKPVGHVAFQIKKNKRAMELLSQCPLDSVQYLPGYTGFMPLMREKYGMQYQRAACLSKQSSKQANLMANLKQKQLEDYILSSIPIPLSESKKSSLQVIPGYTGFIPLSKYSYATTFGKKQMDNVPQKNLEITPPIAGYQGFVPIMQQRGQQAFGPTSKQCIKEFKAKMNH